MSAYLKKLEGQPVVVDKSYERYYYDLEYYHEGKEDQCFVCGIEKAKAKYEGEKDALAELIKLGNEMRKEEIMEAVLKSEHSYAEIMAFIKGEGDEE